MENRIDIPICVAIFTLLVATTAVSLRIYTRKVLINQLGIDDYCAVVALVRPRLQDPRKAMAMGWQVLM